MKLLDEAKYLRKDAIYEDYYKIIKNFKNYIKISKQCKSFTRFKKN